MPCLNEAETLAACIQTARLGLQRAGVRGEILVADNGSTDGSQAIAAAAHFLEFDGLIVPCARSPALHLVIFLERCLQDAVVVQGTEPVDWATWRGPAR